jgi:hypothetical protein
MEAKQFFETEKLPESTFEKIPIGMIIIKTNSIDITPTEKDFGNGKKTRYILKFETKKGDEKEYEVGIQIIKGIEEALPKETEYLILTRQGKGREDTVYTVAAMEE